MNRLILDTPQKVVYAIKSTIIGFKSSMTRLINVLVKKNLAVRVSKNSDQSNKLIYLTQKGKELPKELSNPVKETLQKAQEGISTYEIEIYKNVLCCRPLKTLNDWI